MSKQKFEALKESLIKDIETVIWFNMEDFKASTSYTEKSDYLESIRCWTVARDEIKKLEFNLSSYDYLKEYYEERGFDANELKEVFELDENDNKKIGLIILGVFEGDGYKLKNENNKIIVTHEDCEDMIYSSWNEFLNDWKESVEIDLSNGLCYLSTEQCKKMGIKI